MSIMYAANDPGSSPTNYITPSSGVLPARIRVAGFFVAAALAGTSAPSLPASSGPLTGVFSAPPSTANDAASSQRSRPEQMEDSDLVTWIKSTSGLTWEQFARVLGVSRRAVHLWANGGRINGANAETLREFAAIVAAVDGVTPEAGRAALLAVSTKDGLSALDRLRQRVDQRTTTATPPAFSVRELLGAGAEGDETDA